MSLDLYKALKAEFPNLDELIASKLPLHYKVYKIPKRTLGFRTIAQPTSQLKEIQRALVGILESKVHVHKCATAYRKGVGIKENASPHLMSNYLLKVDLENFFNSLTPQMLFKAIESQSITLSGPDKYIIEQVAFWNRARRKNGRLILSVGAPSSPLISNIILLAFDRKINDICQSKKINYTRYADDMTFSTKNKNILPEILSDVKKTLKSSFGSRLAINEQKTIFSSKAHNRHVTGITITNDNKPSIGRDRKRYISALVHKFKNSNLTILDIYHLKGLLSYVSHIEHSFLRRLEKKYGKDTIDLIIRYT